MYSLAIFVIVIFSMSIIGLRYRVPPFVLLVGGAIIYGVAVGVPAETLFEEIPSGLAGVFLLLAIPILAGSVMAKYIVEQGMVQEMLSDIRKLVKKPVILSSASGYILAPPTTCPVTTFFMLAPVVEHLAGEGKRRSILIYALAIGSTLGAAFIYPTPQNYPLFDIIHTDLSPVSFDLVAIPFSLCILAVVIYFFSKRARKEEPYEGEICIPACTDRFHWRAWAPFITILIAIPIGWELLHLQHFGLVQFIMLVGMITAVIVARPDVRHSGFLIGAKHAGVVIFDVCGAGALGYVITQSMFTTDALHLVGNDLPLLIFPFILAVLIQTAQGSRIVTSVVTAQIIASNGLQSAYNPLALFLMIIAGACILSFVTDPLFWVLHRITNDDVKTVFKNYTLPQVIIGLVTLAFALGINYLYPPL
jgi:gluconate:H+ symporter, GntP family